MENIRRKNNGGARSKKRGARASVFLKIFTAHGCRANKCRANCAAHETRAAAHETRGAALKTRIPVSGQKTVINQQFTKIAQRGHGLWLRRQGPCF
jgi:hypothetical protein